MNQRSNIGYKIIDSIHIGSTEFVIGYNQKASMPYAVWECQNSDNFCFGSFVSNRATAEQTLLQRASNACSRQAHFISTKELFDVE